MFFAVGGLNDFGLLRGPELSGRFESATYHRVVGFAIKGYELVAATAIQLHAIA